MTAPRQNRHVGFIVVGSVLLGATAFGGLMAATPATGNSGETAVTSQIESLPKPTFRADGSMERPDTRYREWIYVGSPLTPNDLNPPEAPFPEFHNVYTHPDDYAHYARTGEWQDGTVFVKELVSVGTKQATSGNGYFMGEFIGLEVATKDSARFASEPGYWAYFSFGHAYPLADTSNAQPVGACNACHAANADEDWVFTQYYPVLRALETR